MRRRRAQTPVFDHQPEQRHNYVDATDKPLNRRILTHRLTAGHVAIFVQSYRDLRSLFGATAHHSPRIRIQSGFLRFRWSLPNLVASVCKTRGRFAAPAVRRRFLWYIWRVQSTLYIYLYIYVASLRAGCGLICSYGLLLICLYIIMLYYICYVWAFCSSWMARADGWLIELTVGKIRHGKLFGLRSKRARLKMNVNIMCMRNEYDGHIIMCFSI